MDFFALCADGLPCNVSDDDAGAGCVWRDDAGAAGSSRPFRPMCSFSVPGAGGSSAHRAWCGACAGSVDVLPNTGEVLPASGSDELVDDVMPFSFLSFSELD